MCSHETVLSRLRQHKAHQELVRPDNEYGDNWAERIGQNDNAENDSAEYHSDTTVRVRVLRFVCSPSLYPRPFLSEHSRHIGTGQSVPSGITPLQRYSGYCGCDENPSSPSFLYF